jgi:hypothetical protein
VSNVNDWPRPKHPWKDGQRPFGSYAKLASVKNYAVKLFPQQAGFTTMPGCGHHWWRLFLKFIVMMEMIGNLKAMTLDEAEALHLTRCMLSWMMEVVMKQQKLGPMNLLRNSVLRTWKWKPKSS